MIISHFIGKTLSLEPGNWNAPACRQGRDNADLSADDHGKIQRSSAVVSALSAGLYNPQRYPSI